MIIMLKCLKRQRTGPTFEFEFKDEIEFCYSYASSKFELILFTASPSMYAKRVLDHIDPEHRFFDHKLYREFCHYHQVGSE